LATRIRLKRIGAKKRPTYRVVVADSRSPRDGRFIEEIGYYQPVANPEVIKIDAEKALAWIARGAQPSDTVRALFKKAGVWQQRPVKEGTELKVRTGDEAGTGEGAEAGTEVGAEAGTGEGAEAGTEVKEAPVEAVTQHSI
jgi:small subunit ribosomal protein S16